MILSVLATVCAVTRLKIRWNGQLGLDDYILAFTLILIWLQAVGATLRKLTCRDTVPGQR